MRRAEKDRCYRLAHPEDKRVRQARWRAANAVRLNAKDATRRIEKRAMCLVAAARVRARKKGIFFDVDDVEVSRLQRVIDDGRCEVSGVAFTLKGPRSATSPSLDRIRPSLGYVPGNMRIVCHALNAGMGNWGEEILFAIVRAWFSLRIGEGVSS